MPYQLHTEPFAGVLELLELLELLDGTLPLQLAAAGESPDTRIESIFARPLLPVAFKRRVCVPEERLIVVETSPQDVHAPVDAKSRLVTTLPFTNNCAGRLSTLAKRKVSV